MFRLVKIGDYGRVFHGYKLIYYGPYEGAEQFYEKMRKIEEQKIKNRRDFIFYMSCLISATIIILTIILVFGNL